MENKTKLKFSSLIYIICKLFHKIKKISGKEFHYESYKQKLKVSQGRIQYIFFNSENVCTLSFGSQQT